MMIKLNFVKHLMAISFFVCTFSTLQAFLIIDQNNSDDLGYDNCNMYLNGEHLIIKNFINYNALVFDVGANRGEWSKLVLNENTHVNLYAFEPIPQIHKLLKNNFGNNSNVKTFNLAFSSVHGVCDFYYYSSTLQSSELSGFYDREILRNSFNLFPNRIQVSIETLDRFCEDQKISRIDFLKIDTEGAEWKILNGSKKLLEEQRIQSIQFEYGGCYLDANSSLEQIFMMLKEYGYIIFRIIPEGLIHIKKWSNSLETFRYSNYFCILEKEMPKFEKLIFAALNDQNSL